MMTKRLCWIGDALRRDATAVAPNIVDKGPPLSTIFDRSKVTVENQLTMTAGVSLYTANILSDCTGVLYHSLK